MAARSRLSVMQSVVFWKQNVADAQMLAGNALILKSIEANQTPQAAIA